MIDSFWKRESYHNIGLPWTETLICFDVFEVPCIYPLRKMEWVLTWKFLTHSSLVIGSFGKENQIKTLIYYGSCQFWFQLRSFCDADGSHLAGWKWAHHCSLIKRCSIFVSLLICKTQTWSLTVYMYATLFLADCISFVHYCPINYVVSCTEAMFTCRKRFERTLGLVVSFALI